MTAKTLPKSSSDASSHEFEKEIRAKYEKVRIFVAEIDIFLFIIDLKKKHKEKVDYIKI